MEPTHATRGRPWGQLRDEPAHRYAAFCAWAILPRPRRFEPVATVSGRGIEELEGWAQQDFWAERVNALDASQDDALVRASLEHRVREAYESDALQRGAQQRLTMVRALTVVDELVQRAQRLMDASPGTLDPEIVQMLQRLSLPIERMIKLERLAAGQATERTSLDVDLSTLSDEDLEAAIELQRKVRR